MIALAQWIVYLIGVYVACGILFAIPFTTFGVTRLDAAAKGAPIGFRLLIFPGVVALWPYLLQRWLSGAKAPRLEHNAHRDTAREVKR